MQKKYSSLYVFFSFLFYCSRSVLHVNVFLFFLFHSISNLACIPKQEKVFLCFATATDATVYVMFVTEANHKEYADVFKWTKESGLPEMKHCKSTCGTEGICGFAFGSEERAVVVWQETYARIMVTFVEERHPDAYFDYSEDEEDCEDKDDDTFCVNNLTARKDIQEEFGFLIDYFDGPGEEEFDFTGLVFFDLVKFKPSSNVLPNEEVLGECKIGDWVIFDTKENYYVSKA